METLTLKPFNELSKIRSEILLDWFGGITANPHEFDNPLIDCFFCPYIQNADGKINRFISKQIRIGIPVGYLTSLFIGQRYLAGKRSPRHEWPQFETISYQINTSDSKLISETTLTGMRILKPSNPLYERYAEHAGISGLKQLSGKIIKSTHPSYINISRQSPFPIGLYIHELELIRYYLTNSEYSCKNIFSTAFQEDKIFKYIVNSLHDDCPHTQLNPNKSRFVYRHKYSKRDAVSLGRIIFDPEQHALKAARRVHKSIALDRINYVNGSIGYPRTYFPFKQKIVLQITGRRLKTETGYVFLAHQIIDCTAKFPFSYLSYCNEISPGGAKAPGVTEVAFPDKDKIYTGPAEDEEDVGESTGSERPRNQATAIQTTIGTRKFSGLAGVKLKYKKTRDSTHQSGEKTSIYDDSLVNASTGEGTSGETTSVPQKISERIVSPSGITPDLKTFNAAMGIVKILNLDWNLEWVTDSHELLDGTGYMLFPEVPCSIRTTQTRQFSYMDDTQLILRRLICVEIEIKGRHLYLFEAQRRLKDSTSEKSISEYKECLPILLLYKDDWHKCISSNFKYMLEQTVTKGTWPNQEELPSFVRDHTVHRKNKQHIYDLAKRIIVLIKRNLS